MSPGDYHYNLLSYRREIIGYAAVCSITKDGRRHLLRYYETTRYA